MSESSIFTRIRVHELPGEVLYEDNDLFIIMTIRPHNPGHCLVIPVVEEVDLIACTPELTDKLMRAARHMMSVQKQLYDSPRVALVAAGLEVEHTHLHVFPLYESSDLDTSRAQPVDATSLQAEAAKLRAALEDTPISW